MGVRRSFQSNVGVFVGSFLYIFAFYRIQPFPYLTQYAVFMGSVQTFIHFGLMELTGSAHMDILWLIFDQFLNQKSKGMTWREFILHGFSIFLGAIVAILVAMALFRIDKPIRTPIQTNPVILGFFLEFLGYGLLTYTYAAIQRHGGQFSHSSALGLVRWIVSVLAFLETHAIMHGTLTLTTNVLAALWPPLTWDPIWNGLLLFVAQTTGGLLGWIFYIVTHQ